MAAFGHALLKIGGVLAEEMRTATLSNKEMTPDVWDAVMNKETDGTITKLEMSFRKGLEAQGVYTTESLPTVLFPPKDREAKPDEASENETHSQASASNSPPFNPALRHRSADKRH